MEPPFPPETVERPSTQLDGELADADKGPIEAELASNARLLDLLQAWRRNDQIIQQVLRRTN